MFLHVGVRITKRLWYRLSWGRRSLRVERTDGIDSLIRDRQTGPSIPDSNIGFLAVHISADTCRCSSCIYGQKWNQYYQLLNKLYYITAAGATGPSGQLSRAPQPSVHLCQWSHSYLVNTNQLQQNSAIPLAESLNLIFFFFRGVGNICPARRTGKSVKVLDELVWTDWLWQMISNARRRVI